jgi:hypothetical protein
LSALDLLPGTLAYDVLFADPGLRERYLAILGRLAGDTFRPEVLDRMLDEILAAVGPAIAGDPLNDLSGGLDAEARRLRSWIRIRHQTLMEQLPVSEGPPVVINEVLAARALPGRKVAPDWLELYNRSGRPASLGLLFLSDERARPMKWLCPDLVLAPGERILIWCDARLDLGPLHTNFKLDADGEGIGLYSLEEETAWVWDYLRFGPQEIDRSVGRLPDGAPGFRRLACPTPGTSNRESCEVPVSFRRGDADRDGALSLSDSVRILSALFLGEPIECWDAADLDDDGAASITDPIRLLDHLFLGGSPPPAPFPDCGPDPTPDDLRCEPAAGCEAV